MPPQLSDRVLDAARDCVTRFGVSKTTIDDIAREAGCARATVYRSFESRDAVLRAMVRREWSRVCFRVLDAAGEHDNLVDALGTALLAAADSIATNHALAFVMAHESELVLPYVSFGGASLVLDAGAGLFADVADRFIDRAAALRLGEWLTRMTLSLLSCPSDQFALDDPVAIQRLLHEFVLPALDTETARPRG